MRLDPSGQRLQFHLARANPQVEALERRGRATVVFHGPHAYVSPRHYAAPNVPTWNFAAVHVDGAVRAFDAAATAELVADFSRDYEGPDGLGDFVDALNLVRVGDPFGLDYLNKRALPVPEGDEEPEFYSLPDELSGGGSTIFVPPANYTPTSPTTRR
jgi:transcriptional regulator